MRRRWLVAGLAVTALAGGAALARYTWLPSYRPELRPGETYGIDVSRHQGVVDWRRVAGDGIAFAYVKATEGGDLVDTRFAANWTGARDAGLDRGAYHFFTLCTPGATQAANFLAVVPDEPALPPALDLELAGNCSRRPDAATVEREVRAFVTAVEARGPRVMLYVGGDFADRYFRDLDGREQWVPDVLRRPGGTWRVWQASAWARVDGVEGPVDLDVRRSQ